VTGFTPPEIVAGTGYARPVRKISSLPATGTLVFHVLCIESKEVEAQVAAGSKTITALGTGKA